MSNKTDNEADVGRHKFEVAGLGRAPFSFIGVEQKTFQAHHSAPVQPGGTCDYCGTALVFCFHIRSADGRESIVGCNCIEKVGDEGILRAYRSSREYRDQQAAKRRAEDKATIAELSALIASNSHALAEMPHPQGFTDRQTGRRLTMLDRAQWMARNAGHAGRKSTVKLIKRALASMLDEMVSESVQKTNRFLSETEAA